MHTKIFIDPLGVEKFTINIRPSNLYTIENTCTLHTNKQNICASRRSGEPPGTVTTHPSMQYYTALRVLYPLGAFKGYLASPPIRGRPFHLGHHWREKSWKCSCVAAKECKQVHTLLWSLQIVSKSGGKIIIIHHFSHFLCFLENLLIIFRTHCYELEHIFEEHCV